MRPAARDRSRRTQARSPLCVAVLFGALPAVLDAQAPRHRVPSGDTLRWREVRTTTVLSETARVFETRSEIRQEGAIRVFRGAADTVVVSYDSVSATVGLSGSNRRISMPFERGAPVKLTLTDSGCVRVFEDSVESAPLDMASALAAARRLSPPFDDLFIPLPSVPLAIGVSWPTGTQSAEGTSRAPDVDVSQPDQSYRVVRDTTVGGTHAFVIEAQFSSTSHRSGRSVNPLSIDSSRDSSQERRVIVFDPVAGRVIARRSTGERRSAMTVKTDGGGSFDTKSLSTYEHRLELVLP
jgi:hypothetical protein